MGIPLRADLGARTREQRRSFVRGCTAMVLAETRERKADAGIICQRAWPNDSDARLIARGAVSPLTTGDFVKIDVIKLLTSLAPRSAASKLFELSQPIDLTGINSVLFPLPSGLPTATFIAEGAPIPVVQGMLSNAMRCGPVRKMALISPLTEELQNASADTASVVIERLLEIGISRSLDKALFSDDAETPLAPAGLRAGVTPISAGASMSEDLGNLVETIAAAGFDPESAAFLAAPAQAMAMRLVAGPHFEYKIIGAHGLPPKTVMAIDTGALAFSYADAPEVQLRKEPSIHFADAPLPLVNSGVVASPAKNLWQCGLMALRTIARIAWAAGAGSVAVVEGVSW
jgi:hypothetical protein